MKPINSSVQNELKIQKSTVSVVSEEKSNSYDLNNNYEKSGTVRAFKTRHIQLIAIGGAIGTGLFIGTGAALHTTGPAPLLMSYIIMSFLVWILMNLIGEMVVFLPLPGETTLHALAKKYASNSIAFTAGWNLFYAQAITVAAEITACAFLVQYWTDVHHAVFISIFYVLTTLVNLGPVKYFGEAEFWIAIIKVVAIVGLTIVGVVIFFGGAPKQNHVLGFHYWKRPGPFAEHLASGNTARFLDFWTALVKSGFSFIFSPEIIGSCTGETENPKRNIPKACKRFIIRLVLFYVMSSLVIGVIVAYNEPRLTNSGDTTNAAASPFVIGIQNVGINLLNHIINACILTSAFSSGNAQFYGATRGLYTISLRGDAPKVFSRVNKHGVPYYCVLLASMISLLSYLNCSNSSSVVFAWLTNISTISGFISWIFIYHLSSI